MNEKLKKTLEILTNVGAVAWGIYGLGLLTGKQDWNIVQGIFNMLGYPQYTYLVYIPVGIGGAIGLYSIIKKK